MCRVFHFFGTDHCVALLVVLGLSGALVYWTRAAPARRGTPARWTLALVLLFAHGLWHFASLRRGEWSLVKHLPLHLCDGAAIMNVGALLLRRPRLVEISCLWGLAAAFPALFSPDLTQGFPDVFFWTYFLNHGVLVATPLLFVYGLGERLAPAAAFRVFLATNLWALLAGAFDLALGANYMFLRHPPSAGSPLDHLGPWPWYLVVCEGIALGFFLLIERVLPKRARARA